MVFGASRAGLVGSLPRVNSPRDFLTGYVVPVLGIYLFWLYCNKFLGMSIGYLSTMARDITIAGTQMNTSYYPCLLYTSPSPRDVEESRMPSSA